MAVLTAISDVPRATLRADLRSRLPEENRTEILDTELNRFLDLGQYDAALKLSGINTIWYGKKETVTIGSGVIDISGYSIMRIIKLVDADNGRIPFFDEAGFEELGGNYAYDATRAVSHFGDELDVFAGDSAPAVGTLTLYFYRKPASMDDTTDEKIDVPDEFQEMVVAFAEKKALQRLGLPVTAKEEELQLAWRAIQQAYGNEFKLEQAGERGQDG